MTIPHSRQHQCTQNSGSSSGTHSSTSLRPRLHNAVGWSRVTQPNVQVGTFCATGGYLLQPLLHTRSACSDGGQGQHSCHTLLALAARTPQSLSARLLAASQLTKHHTQGPASLTAALVAHTHSAPSTVLQVTTLATLNPHSIHQHTKPDIHGSMSISCRMRATDQLIHHTFLLCWPSSLPLALPRPTKLHP
jgi:hypothetical protein